MENLQKNNGIAMNDDSTISAPLTINPKDSVNLLCATLVWHTESQLVGRQIFSTNGKIDISRQSSLFHSADNPEASLGCRTISRRPVTVHYYAGEMEISVPSGAMVVEVNKREVVGVVKLQQHDIKAGVTIFLGRTALLLINFRYSLSRLHQEKTFIGVSEAAQAIRDSICQVATKIKEPVLLLGETGTGKEIAAKAIYEATEDYKRKAHNKPGPLLSVNMAGVPEQLAAADLFGSNKGSFTGAQTSRQGYFAAADNGTLFLDEIGNTPLSIQPMLLRVLETGDYRSLGSLEDKRFNGRLISATDQNIYQDEKFNQALLRRLECHVIVIPPLRERREDIGVLLRHFMEDYESKTARSLLLDPMFVNQLVHYEWPGNVRQLKQVFNRAVLKIENGSQPVFEDLVTDPSCNKSLPDTTCSEDPKVIDNTKTIRKKLVDFTKDDIVRAMEKYNGNVQGAAQFLGISRPSMYVLLERHSVKRREIEEFFETQNE